jgi:16S rRNA (guanine527-N7)-methyltransferase
VTADVLERWLEELLATPGVTAIRDVEQARSMLVADALRATDLVASAPAGPVIDVGSGGGSPGLPLAVALPERRFVLLDAQRRRCDFLRRIAVSLPNVEVVWGRAESQSTDTFAVALAKALAKAPVAAELCLPLVCPGGIAILWIGEEADVDAAITAAERVGGAVDSREDGLLVLRKVGVTPEGFPRRPGLAKKRPLA